MSLQLLHKPFTILLGSECRQIHLTRSKDTGRPPLWKDNLDTWRDIRLKVCSNAPLLKELLKRQARQLGAVGKLGCIVHQHNTTRQMLPSSLYKALWRKVSKDRLQMLQRRRLISRIKNARHVKHPIVKDLDGDLLLRKLAVAIVKQNDCDGIVAKARRNNLACISTLNLVPLALASPQNAPLLNLDERVRDRKQVQQAIRVHLHLVCMKHYHGGQIWSAEHF